MDLKNLKVQEMNTSEMIEVDGGLPWYIEIGLWVGENWDEISAGNAAWRKEHNHK